MADDDGFVDPFDAPPGPPPPPLLTSTAALLADAQTAYHKLVTGTAVVRVRDTNGQEVQYSQASISRLLAYIQTLTDALNPSIRINGPMRVWF